MGKAWRPWESQKSKRNMARCGMSHKNVLWEYILLPVAIVKYLKVSSEDTKQQKRYLEIKLQCFSSEGTPYGDSR